MVASVAPIGKDLNERKVFQFQNASMKAFSWNFCGYIANDNFVKNFKKLIQFQNHYLQKAPKIAVILPNPQIWCHLYYNEF